MYSSIEAICLTVFGIVAVAAVAAVRIAHWKYKKNWK